MLWIGVLADRATVNEFFLGLAVAMGDDRDSPLVHASLDQYEAYRDDAPVAEILESIRESDPPDDAHFTG